MNEIVRLPLIHQGQEREFEATLQAWAYGHRFFVDVDGVEVTFEKDDAGSYRAIVHPSQAGALPDAGLIQAIAGMLQSL